MTTKSFTTQDEWLLDAHRAGYTVTFTTRKIFAWTTDREVRGAFDIASSTGSLQLDTQ